MLIAIDIAPAMFTFKYFRKLDIYELSDPLSCRLDYSLAWFIICKYFIDVNISERKSWTERTKNWESAQAQIYGETTVTHEICTKVPSRVFHRQSAQLDFARANIIPK